MAEPPRDLSLTGQGRDLRRRDECHHRTTARAEEKLLGRLEANYQYLLARETATLRLTRKLSDGEYRTSNVTSVALDEDALAALSPASTDNKHE